MENGAFRRTAALILALGRPQQIPKFVTVQRSSKTAFMPGVHVFPGGHCDEADFSPDWLAVFGRHASRFLALPSTTGSSSSIATVELDGRLPASIALRLTALRETFEETGLLLAVDSSLSSCLESGAEEALRQKVAAAAAPNGLAVVRSDARNFVRLCRDHSICPDLARLHEWSGWITPAGIGGPEARRYNTRFFFAALTEAPNIAKPDDGETVSIRIDTAGALIRSYLTKTIVLAPPQLYDLSRLGTFSCSAQIEEAAARRELFGVETWTPVMVSLRDGFMLTLPGDALYPASPDTQCVPISLDMTIDECQLAYPCKNRYVVSKRSVTKLYTTMSLVRGQMVPPSLTSYLAADVGNSHL